MKSFDKYERLGDYHWKEYARRESVYRSYVDGLRTWVAVTGRVLDIGAGDGLITHVLDAEGIELDPTAVQLACAHEVDVIEGDAAALPYDAGSFDVVFMGDVIEHLEDPVPSIKEARRVLRDGSYFYVTTPPRGPSLRPYHFREYTPAELVDEVARHGFVLSEPTFTAHDRIHARFEAV